MNSIVTVWAISWFLLGSASIGYVAADYVERRRERRAMEAAEQDWQTLINETLNQPSLFEENYNNESGNNK